MDAVALVDETRVGASGESAGDGLGASIGGRLYAARDLGERLSIGLEGAWALASWSSTGTSDLRDRERGRAVVFFALRTAPARAEASIAAGFGLSAQRRARELPDNSREWLAIEPTFCSAAWASGRVWVASFLALELEAGAILTREPYSSVGTSTGLRTFGHRAFVAPVVRAGFVVRF